MIIIVIYYSQTMIIIVIITVKPPIKMFHAPFRLTFQLETATSISKITLNSHLRKISES